MLLAKLPNFGFRAADFNTRGGRLQAIQNDPPSTCYFNKDFRLTSNGSRMESILSLCVCVCLGACLYVCCYVRYIRAH